MKENQLRVFFEYNSVVPEFQYGFRSAHSYKMTLLDIRDNIVRASDESRLTVLVMPDFSRAFNCASSIILLAILKPVGLSSSALGMLREYLCDRYQKVTINQICTNVLPLQRGMSQGSILAPLCESVECICIQTMFSCIIRLHLKMQHMPFHLSIIRCH